MYWPIPGIHLQPNLSILWALEVCLNSVLFTCLVFCDQAIALHLIPQKAPYLGPPFLWPEVSLTSASFPGILMEFSVSNGSVARSPLLFWTLSDAACLPEAWSWCISASFTYTPHPRPPCPDACPASPSACPPVLPKPISDRTYLVSLSSLGLCFRNKCPSNSN